MYIGRFAPSPTGALHRGSLLAAVASRCDALHHRGHWLVRIDDIDPPRAIPGADTEILNALEQHGLAWHGQVQYQSSHQDRYQSALATLHTQGVLFGCQCSRRDLAGHALYPGTCHHRPPFNAGEAIRCRLSGTAHHQELFEQTGGCQTLWANQLGDQIVQRRDGLVSYALAAAVDDSCEESGITHVIRGGDLLPTTAVQVALQALLDRPTPIYGHVPIAVNSAGQKLSKQTRATALQAHDPVDNLRWAWHALGQTVIAADSVEEFWDQATKLWQRKTVPQGTPAVADA